MTHDIEMKALVGTNPLGFFAALGALDAAGRHTDGPAPSLRWTDDLTPTAVLTCPWSLDELCEVLDSDRRTWASGPILDWSPPDSTPLAEIKPPMDVVGSWAAEVCAKGAPDARKWADLWQALLSEGAEARGKREAKPTHFHFTAGQQRFLAMVRELSENVTSDDIREALAGPWRYESTLPVLGWDSRGERIHALRGTKPANDQKRGVPGADWLAFVGLTFFPTAARSVRSGQAVLDTTGCTGTWKHGSFVWPLWRGPLSAPVVRSLVRQSLKLTQTARDAYGISAVLQAPIRRADQGGYGSFGTAEEVLPEPA